MFVELHLLQNFAPSCLNRDDTNSPKDCEFGGYRRARISSQCIKRAVRKYFREQKLLPKDHLAERSKRLIGEIQSLLHKNGRSTDATAGVVKKALAAVNLAADDDNATQYLLFLGRTEIANLASVVDRHWDALSSAGSSAPAPAAEEGKARAKTKKQQKAEARGAVPADVAKQVKAIFNGGKAADVALFGRMLADQADLNIDAACQVAHALSTNAVNMEMDFFTAVDDLKDRDADDAGAGMLGTVEFNSACYYRYANIDFDQLSTTLQEDAGLACRTVEAFLKASIHAIPTGKQNTFAAHNPPSLVVAVVRDNGLFSLANAFEKPVQPTRKGSLMQNSVKALGDYWSQLTRMYSDNQPNVVSVCALDESMWEPREEGKSESAPLAAFKKEDRASNVEEVVKKVMAALPCAKEA